MTFAAAYGLLAYGVIFGALAALLPLSELRARAALAATAVALLVGIAPLLHGVFGPPSLTLLQLAVLRLAGRAPAPFGPHAAPALLACALPFYAAALGWGPVDPYGLGYQPWPLLAALLPLAAVLWWRNLAGGLAILAIDLAGYASGLFANLWDALVDPLLVLLALIVVLRRLAIRLIASRPR